MKQFLAVLLSLTTFPFFSSAAQSVTAKMVCESIRFQQGADSFGLFTLDISSYDPTDPSTPPNGELLPTFSSSYSHGTYFAINDPTGYDPMVGLLSLNVPSITDTNTGMNSFFEVSQGISAATSGAYSISGFASGPVTATWTRQASSATGQCKLDFGSLGVFTHTFSITEYAGPLTYTPGSTVVSGTITFTNSVDPTQSITGAVQFVKSTTNPTDELDLQPVSWTNNAGLPLTTSYPDPFYRDTEQGTNYYGYVQFDDGDPTTPLPDYESWFVYFIDTNDSNQDGIPDFSDSPKLPPTLTISLGTTNLFINISGAGVGGTCNVLQATNANFTNYQSVLSVTLTNDPQLISMPLSLTNAPTFWRTLVQ